MYVTYAYFLTLLHFSADALNELTEELEMDQKHLMNNTTKFEEF